MSKSPEDRAAELVRVEVIDGDTDEPYRILVGDKVHESFAKERAATCERDILRGYIAAAVRDAEAALLRLAPGEPPVSEERVAKCREMVNRHHLQEEARNYPNGPSRVMTDLLALTDWQARLIALLCHDSQAFQEGLDAGRREARALLERLEWSGRGPTYYGNPVACFICGGFLATGHLPGCELAKALGRG